MKVMTSEEHNPRSRQIDAAIAMYLEAVERGQPIDREAFLAGHPGIADDLREFLADEIRFERQAPHLAASGDETTDLSGRKSQQLEPLNVICYFGDYELLEEIARGGMGVVYKARQTTLNRTVAVKM